MYNISHHLILKKGLNTKLSDNLHQSEIDCKCEFDRCYYTLFDIRLIKAFELLRTSCGNRALNITSAYRCQTHNKKVLGIKNSYHTIGSALDLVPPKNMPIDEFAYRAATFFTKVIVYRDKNFIHCHIE